MLNKKISIKEYAKLHNKSVYTVRQKAQRGGFETALKIGRDWFIDPDEPYKDLRLKNEKEKKDEIIK